MEVLNMKKKLVDKNIKYIIVQTIVSSFMCSAFIVGVL